MIGLMEVTGRLDVAPGAVVPLAAPPPPLRPSPPGGASSPFDRLSHAIRAVAPHLSPSDVVMWSTALAPPMRRFNIDRVQPIAAFLGQVAVESNGFRALSENLNYTAERLVEVWPGRFTSKGDAADYYAHNPPRLANFIYAGRLGNGDEASGDGWTFRGSGLIQITGRSMHTRIADVFGGPKTFASAAVWMQTISGAAVSACWYWALADHRPSLNSLAMDWNIEAITRSINGGLTGYQDRLRASIAARSALMAA